jgi:hypothetical protein
VMACLQDGNQGRMFMWVQAAGRQPFVGPFTDGNYKREDFVRALVYVVGIMAGS